MLAWYVYILVYVCYVCMILKMHNASSLYLTVNYYIATDVVDNGSMLSELALAVFEENFALLCNTITDINLPLTEQFLKEKIITAEEERQVAAITAPLEKLLHLLEIISSSLKANNTRSFHIMVKVMKTHGGKQTQTLANHMMNRLKVSTDEVIHVCSDKVLVQNESKGIKYSIPYSGKVWQIDSFRTFGKLIDQPIGYLL